MSPYFYSVVVSFAVALALLTWFVRGGLSKLALDQPNHRSLHTSPIPRTGGLALMSGVLIGWLFIQEKALWMLMPSVLLLIAISFLDDLCSLSAGSRFITHFLAVGIFIGLSGLQPIGFIGIVLVLLVLVWMINLYNFMDGSDGLAGGMTLFGFGFYGLAAWLHGDVTFSLMNWSIAATALAFLFFNFHPARLFMGDAGSIPLGFLAAALGIIGLQRGIWPIWFPVLVFSPFIVDATTTLVKRVLRGKKIWQAHRSHYYQRMVQMGFGHRTTALYEYLLMLLVGMSALWGQSHSSGVAYMLGVWAVVYGVILFCIDSKWSSRSSA